jgi:hypothetical protein
MGTLATGFQLRKPTGTKLIHSMQIRAANFFLAHHTKMGENKPNYNKINK